MSQWHLLRRPRPTRPGLGYWAQHGAALSVYYSTNAVLAPPRSSMRSFCLSAEKQSLQQLNVRLSSYLQKVHHLEATNQRLELQIQEELERRFPAGLKEVEGILKMSSLLQDQINESVSLQARLKLQLLGAELTVFDLNNRCEKEREQRGRVEADLAELKLLEEALKVHKLPELQNLLWDKKQELQELQMQSQQEKLLLRDQISGGVSVEVKIAESSHLIQQLELLRQRNQTESWTTVSMLTPPKVTFDPAGPSEADHAQLEGLRRISTDLIKELKELHAAMSVLEASGHQQTESLALQQLVLQQTADGLHGDLDSVLHATAQQATEHQLLLDVRSQLEAEIQDYSRLLNELPQKGVSNLLRNTKSAPPAPGLTPRPSTTKNSINVEGESPRVREVKAVSRGYVHDRHSKKSPVISVNSSNQSLSFQKSENQRTVAPSEKSGSDSSTISSTVSRQRNVMVNRVNVQDTESTEVQVQDIAKVAAVNTSRTKITSTVASESKSKSTPDTLTSRQVEADITGPLVGPEETKSDSGKPAAADIKIETKILPQIESIVQTMNINSTHSPSEAISDIGECRSQAFGSAEVEVFDEVNLINGKDSGGQTNSEEVVAEAGHALQCDQSLERSDVSNNEPNRLKEEAVTGSNGTTPPTCISDSRNYNEPDSLKMEVTKVKVVRTDSTDQEEIVYVTLNSGVDSNSSIAKLFPNKINKDEEEVKVEHLLTADQPLIDTDIFKSEPRKVIEDARSDTSSGNLESTGSLERTTDCTEIVEVNQDVLEVFHEPSEVKMDPPKIDKESVDLTGQDVFVTTKESTKSPNMTDSGMDLSPRQISNTPEIYLFPNEDPEPVTNVCNEVELVRDTIEAKPDLDQRGPRSTSLTDSGLALSFSSTEEPLSPKESDLFTNQLIKCSSPEICLSPVETEMLLGANEHMFHPANVEEHVMSPDLLLSPNDPGMFLSPEDSCLSPVEVEGCLSPGNEEEEDEDEVCLSLTEAGVHVRPVEKYILSTKEESQSISFSRLSPEKENKKSVTSERGGGSLSFGLFESNEGRKVDLDVTNSDSRPASEESSMTMSSGPGGSELGGIQRIIADKEEQVGFGGLYRRSKRDSASFSENYRDTSRNKKDSESVSGDVNVTNSDGAAGTPGRFRPGGGERMTYGTSVKQTSLPNTGSEERPSTNQPAAGRFGSGEWTVYGGSFRRKSSLEGGATLTSGGNEKSPSGKSNVVTNQPETGRFGRKGSGEWIVYGGSVERQSNDGFAKIDAKEQPSENLKLATSPPGSGRFDGKVGRERTVYGGSLRSKSRMEAGAILPSEEPEKSPSVGLKDSKNPPERGRFGSRGSGEWMVYSGERMSQPVGTDSSPRSGGGNNPSTIQLATSPPETGRFGRRGSGEWRVYGGSLKCNSSDGLPKNESEENQSEIKFPISPPGSAAAGRFGSRGSGEWRVYGGGAGRMSRSVDIKGLPGSERGEYGSETIPLPLSPPGSLGTGRFWSGGSGEWRVYGSSSGRLSSAGSSDGEGRVFSPPSSYTGQRPRLSRAGSGGTLSYGGVVKRSSSVGSGGRLSSSPGTLRTSSSGRHNSESKPVYSSATRHRNSSGGAGQPSGGSQRAPSPGGRTGVSSGYRTTGGGGSKSSGGGSNERISMWAGGRMSGSSGSGRTNSTGGRAISSSDRPIRTTGSGTGGNKERISVCKMAALSISAAGRERKQESRRKQQQKEKQQQSTVVSPLVQSWLSGGKLTNVENADDILKL